MSCQHPASSLLGFAALYWILKRTLRYMEDPRIKTLHALEIVLSQDEGDDEPFMVIEDLCNAATTCVALKDRGERVDRLIAIMHFHDSNNYLECFWPKSSPDWWGDSP